MKSRAGLLHWLRRVWLGPRLLQWPHWLHGLQFTQPSPSPPLPAAFGRQTLLDLATAERQTYRADGLHYGSMSLCGVYLLAFQCAGCRDRGPELDRRPRGTDKSSSQCLSFWR